MHSLARVRMIAAVKKFGGRYVNTGSLAYDGIEYQYCCEWDEEEQADAFLGTLPPDRTVSDRSIVNGCVTLYLSVEDL